ncbi:MAG: efflux RND transporter periplasmic adaptor subunit [Candidatus Saganbacteria bacterium]|nr:efflux RND transporter periplasmic adaptor subunit [Candidatus Saganbacteria bacterium]
MKTKRIVWIILVLLVLLLFYRACTRIRSAKKLETGRIIPVTVTTPKIGTIENILTLTGDIKGESEVSVRPRIAGRVEEIFVKEGDHVSKGDVLLSFLAGIKEDDPIYEDMVVRAPISGFIGMQLVKIGDQVISSVGTNNPVFVIYGIDNVKIYANVPEKFYTLVSKGTPAMIYPDALPGKVFRGSVSRIRPVIDPSTRTIQVEIIIPNTSYIIRPGMFAKVDLILQKKSNVMIIPSDAVLNNEEDYVFTADNGHAMKKNVVKGIESENELEIKSGLLQTDKVIINGQRIVTEGSTIEVK